MTELTAQSVFETVTRHLFSQGQRSFSEKMGCTYRNENGTKCAVGCLLSDEEYEPRLEGSTAMVLFGEGKLQEYAPFEHMLGELQLVHDNTDNWETSEAMTNALIAVGTAHRLSVEFIDGLYFDQDK